MADFNGTSGNDAIQPFGSSLLLTLSGSPGEGGVYPTINVLVNGGVLVSGLTVNANHDSGATQLVSVPLPSGTTVSSISLQYTNDPQLDYTHGDRNLYVSSITLNGKVLPVESATYLRTGGASITGQSELNWGGSLEFAGSVVTSATAHTGGTVSVDGLGGIDTALFANAQSGYSVTKTASGYTVSGNGETATLANVERLQFSDHSLAVDMTGNAGTVAKIIAAVFGTAYLGTREFVGLGLDLIDGGVSAHDAAGLAASTTLFTQLAGSSSNTDFVKFVYHNVFGSDPSASDLNQYVGYLNTGVYTKADLAVLASDSGANAAHLVGVMNTGIEFV